MKLFLCLINFTSGYNGEWGSGSTVPPLLTLAPDELNARLHALADLTPGEKLSVSPKTGPNTIINRKFACLCRDSNPDSTVIQAHV
jgi:hypothetical protein